MMHTSKLTQRALAVGGSAALLSVAAFGSPAVAQTKQEGLVNVSLTNTTVQVPVAVAANICGVAVSVLSGALLQGPVDCAAIGGAEGNSVQNGDSKTTQRGLVNVSATNTTVQIPIGVAANICGVKVKVLAAASAAAPVECTAEGVAIANA